MWLIWIFVAYYVILFLLMLYQWWQYCFVVLKFWWRSCYWCGECCLQLYHSVKDRRGGDENSMLSSPLLHIEDGLPIVDVKDIGEAG